MSKRLLIAWCYLALSRKVVHMNNEDQHTEGLNQKLKDFFIKNRENAGLSQYDVSVRSDVFGIGQVLDQRTVSRIENSPINADALKIAAYLTAIGIEPTKYYEYLMEITKSNDTDLSLSLKKSDLHKKVKKLTYKINDIKQSIEKFDHNYLNETNLVDNLAALELFVKSFDKKPILGCFGAFDSGKSTLINTIIHKQILPTRYQPATCIVNLLMHTSDRPESIKSDVLVFKKGFLPYMIHDNELMEKYLVEEGSYALLEKLGLRNYEEELNKENFMAVIFADSEILKHVWLLDTPGDLNNDDGDDIEKALSSVELVDGVIFVSTHTGFLKDTDLGFSSNIIRNKPPFNPEKPFEHLLFVQSHCHSELKPEDVKYVGKTAFKRVKRQLENLIFNDWVEDGFLKNLPESDHLSQRVQPFWRENNEYRLDTLQQVNQMANFLSAQQEEITDQEFKKVNSKLRSLIKSNEKELRNKKKVSIERQQEAESAKKQFEAKRKGLLKEVDTLISQSVDFRNKDLKTVETYYDNLVSVDWLEELIRDTYTDKKEAQSEIGSYIGQLISAKVESTLKKSGKTYSNATNDLIEKWQAVVPRIVDIDVEDIDGINVDFNLFDAKAAFIGGLSGLGSLGAMALYVSTIASNLGAYIIVGKVAGVLASLGLVGNVTVVTSFVAAIGGPITIGLAIATGIGLAIYGLFGGSWQKSLAKKLATAIKKENLLSRMNSNIIDYWDKTAKATKAGFAGIDQDINSYSDKLLLESKNHYDHDELEKCIQQLNSVIKLVD